MHCTALFFTTRGWTIVVAHSECDILHELLGCVFAGHRLSAWIRRTSHLKLRHSISKEFTILFYFPFRILVPRGHSNLHNRNRDKYSRWASCRSTDLKGSGDLICDRIALHPTHRMTKTKTTAVAKGQFLSTRWSWTKPKRSRKMLRIVM